MFLGKLRAEMISNGHWEKAIKSNWDVPDSLVMQSVSPIKPLPVQLAMMFSLKQESSLLAWAIERVECDVYPPKPTVGEASLAASLTQGFPVIVIFSHFCRLNLSNPVPVLCSCSCSCSCSARPHHSLPVLSLLPIMRGTAVPGQDCDWPVWKDEPAPCNKGEVH
jgi:hypothetical protein